MKASQKYQKTIQEKNEHGNQDSSGVPGCWPIFLLPFASVGTFLVIQSFTILRYVWSHPNIPSMGGYYRLGHYYYPVPQSLPADPQTLDLMRGSLVFSGIICGVFALVLLIVWLVILAWFISLFASSPSTADQSALPKQPAYDARSAEDDAEQIQSSAFTWQEQRYLVDLVVYTLKMNILLPDGTLLQPEGGWQEETWPPVPTGLVAVSYERQSDEPLEVIAERLNAGIARKWNVLPA